MKEMNSIEKKVFKPKFLRCMECHNWNGRIGPKRKTCKVKKNYITNNENIFTSCKDGVITNQTLWKLKARVDYILKTPKYDIDTELQEVIEKMQKYYFIFLESNGD